jgi:1-acyl-sn-glycerol-3-phosphate acyltransferase
MVKTIVAFVVTILTIIFYTPVGIVCIILSLIGLKKPMSWIIYKIAQVWARIIILVTGCAMDVKGRENIPSGEGVCFVSNHVGIFDIILALAYAGRPFGFIAKKELFYVPFINIWISMLGGLFIDRKNIRKAKRTIDIGIEKLQNGWNMLIFPEGTRSKGQGLLPFRSGAIKLATNSLAPIVPIAITGSYEVFEKHYRVHGVPIRMVFCPVINTSELSGEDRRHLLPDQVRSVIEDALNSQS